MKKIDSKEFEDEEFEIKSQVSSDTEAMV